MKLKELVDEGYLIETSTQYIIAKPFTVTAPLTLDKTLVLPSNWTMKTDENVSFYPTEQKQIIHTNQSQEKVKN